LQQKQTYEVTAAEKGRDESKSVMMRKATRGATPQKDNNSQQLVAVRSSRHFHIIIKQYLTIDINNRKYMICNVMY